MFGSIFIAGLLATVACASPLEARSGTSSTSTHVPSSTTTTSHTTTTTSHSTTTTSHSTTITSHFTTTTSHSTKPTSHINKSVHVKPSSTNPAIPSGLIASLLTADSEVSRFKLLASKDPTHQIFNFNPSANASIKPSAFGQISPATRANFPILTILDLSASISFFPPAASPPHTHAHASEFFTVATNGSIATGFILESSFMYEFNTQLSQYHGTVFPQGSIHFQQNLECTPQVGISGFSSEDPGVSNVAQNFFAMDPAVVNATLGFPTQIDGNNFKRFRERIPEGFAKGWRVV